MPTLRFGKVCRLGIVFCNLGTSKTIISKFVTTVNIVTPYSSRVIWPPQQRSRGTKKRLSRKKSQGQKSIIHKCINSFLAHKLSHDRWLCFFFGRLQVPTRCYIWWCLRTGGGGVLTREHYFLLLTLQLMPVYLSAELTLATLSFRQTLLVRPELIPITNWNIVWPS
jgi:hypothetical protein